MEGDNGVTGPVGATGATGATGPTGPPVQAPTNEYLLVSTFLNQSIAANAPVRFEIENFQNGTAVTRNPLNDTIINLEGGRTYLITYTFTPVTMTAGFAISIEIDGVPLPYTTVAKSTSSNSFSLTMSATTIFTASPSGGSVRLVNTATSIITINSVPPRQSGASMSIVALT
ncbi:MULTISPECIES: hypothetical protein [Bacillus]|uniref:Collagen-like protein n=1 Tax=Bacillus cereus TaxID=1396 RepID=A0A9X6GD54_BACCE|nr:hypothetical protein [Bacillus cereus]OOR71731.1 hypothetical protein BLX06_28900 [Bacillus cereus]